MANLYCVECGQVFGDSLSDCPNCGCPASVCRPAEVVQKPAASVGGGTPFCDAGSGVIHGSFNEAEPYSPMKFVPWLSADPWPMSRFPKGALDRRVPVLGWLFAPWHLTCRDERSRESYDTINNVFYLCNLIFKAYTYASLWAFFKGWLILLAGVVVVGLQMAISSGVRSLCSDYDTSGAINSVFSFLFVIIYIALAIAFVCMEAYAVGKALHRYWGNWHGTWRRLNRRYWMSMDRAKKSGNVDCA